MYSTISQCRICGNQELDRILDLGMQALTGVFPKHGNTNVMVSPLELVKCHDGDARDACGLVQLRHSFEPDQMYGMNYGYRSGLNQSMVRHLQEKAKRIKSRVALEAGDIVLDIGSNDSTLLRAMDGPGLRLVGMDPSGIKFREFYPAHVQLIPDFFSAEGFRREFGDKRAKVVTSIAMFYDLESPLDFVKDVYEVLEDEGIWIFEQSYLPTMLERNSYDTVCHEHIEYYALKQILWMFEIAGFTALDVEFNDINGGSFAVTAGKKAAGHARDSAGIERLIRKEEELGLSGAKIYGEFRNRIARHRDELKQFLTKSRERGETILGYGASTKGNVLLQYCGLTADDLVCIAEVNPDKFGAFTPGSRIPIVSEEVARAMKPSGFLVLPWHFRDNIIGREQAFLNSGGKLVFPLPELEVVGN